MNASGSNQYFAATLLLARILWPYQSQGVWAVYVFKYPSSLLTQKMLIEGKYSHSSLQNYLQMWNTTFACIWELDGKILSLYS